MPRPRKVPIKKGKKRVVYSSMDVKIKQTEFCGECERRLKIASTQKPYSKVAMVCDNIEGHKFGQKYFWPLKEVIIITS